MKMTLYLIVDIYGDARVVKRQPHPAVGEIVVQLKLSLPTPPRLAAVLDIDLPEPPDAVIDAAVEEWTIADLAEPSDTS